MKPTQEQVIAWALKCGASIKTDCNGNGAFGSGVDLNALAALAYEAGRKDEALQRLNKAAEDNGEEL